VISSELLEVLSIADRILVMHEGRLAAELTHEQATEEAIVAAATGQRSSNGKSEATSL
jgi:rhamnose transport system ATP-binding protein